MSPSGKYEKRSDTHPTPGVMWLGHRDLCPVQWGESCDCDGVEDAYRTAGRCIGCDQPTSGGRCINPRCEERNG